MPIQPTLEERLKTGLGKGSPAKSSKDIKQALKDRKQASDLGRVARENEQLKARLAKPNQSGKQPSLEERLKTKNAPVVPVKEDKGSMLDHLNPFSDWHTRQANSKEKVIQDRMDALTKKGVSNSKASSTLLNEDIVSGKQSAIALSGPQNILGAVTKIPGVTNALDLVSRPGYASANEILGKVTRTKEAFKKGGLQGAGQLARELSAVPTDLNRGRDVLAGLSGKAKTSTSQVYKELGVPANVAAILGIPTDIAVDPTTYFSLGLNAERHLGSHAAQVAERQAAVAKKTAELIDKGLSVNTAKSAVDKLFPEVPGRSFALKNNKGAVIGTTDDVAKSAVNLKRKLMGQTPVENISKVLPDSATTLRNPSVLPPITATSNNAGKKKIFSTTPLDDKSLLRTGNLGENPVHGEFFFRNGYDDRKTSWYTSSPYGNDNSKILGKDTAKNPFVLDESKMIPSIGSFQGAQAAAQLDPSILTTAHIQQLEEITTKLRKLQKTNMSKRGVFHEQQIKQLKTEKQQLLSHKASREALGVPEKQILNEKLILKKLDDYGVDPKVYEYFKGDPRNLAEVLAKQEGIAQGYDAIRGSHKGKPDEFIGLQSGAWEKDTTGMHPDLVNHDPKSYTEEAAGTIYSAQSKRANDIYYQLEDRKYHPQNSTLTDEEAAALQKELDLLDQRGKPISNGNIDNPIVNYRVDAPVPKVPAFNPTEKLFKKLDEVKAKALSGPITHNIASNLSTSVNMPIGTKERLQHITNGGLKQHEIDIATVRDDFKVLTKSEDIKVRHAVESGTRDSFKDIPLANDPTRTLGEFIDKFDQTNKQIFDQEVLAGVRDPKKTPYDPNYSYMSMPGGRFADVTAKRQFKQQRKAEIKRIVDSGGSQLDGMEARSMTTDAAKAQGLNPLEGSSAVLQARISKSTSDIARKQFSDELVRDLGAKPVTAAGIAEVKKQGLVELSPGSGQYVHPEAKQAMDYFTKMQSDAKFAGAASKFLNDSMGVWKLLNTAVRPGSHITNALGDFASAAVGGLSRISPVQKAYSIMRRDAKDFKFTNATGTITKAEIEQSFMTRGANTGQQLVENRELTNSLGSKVLGTPYKILESKPVHALRKVSELREELPRLSTYIDEIEKSMDRGLTKEQAIKNATLRTIKYHFDYQDLTPFEKGVRRKVVPFYTFMRKNTPLMLSSVLTKPGKIAMLPKAMGGMEKFLGTDQPQELDKIKSPFSGLYDLTKSNAKGDNYTFDPKLGITDALKIIKDPIGQFGSALAPGIKEVMQMGGKTSAGLPAGSIKDQVMNETWITRMINDNQKGIKSKSDQLLAGLRAATGLGIQKTSGKSKLFQLKKENQSLKDELKARMSARK